MGGLRHSLLWALLALSASASAQESRGQRWIAPGGPRTRVAFDTGFGIHPAPVRWWLADAEVDTEPGLVIRTGFGLNLHDRARPLRTYGHFALAWRWWRKVEVGATALLASGRDIDDEPGDPRFLAAGPGFYFGVGVPDGLRVTFAIGNVYGAAFGNAVALVYRTQVPVAVTDRLRLLAVARGFFAWPRPVLSVHRLQLEAIVDGQWKLFGGAIFDGGDGSSMAGPSVGGSIGLILGLGVRTP